MVAICSWASKISLTQSSQRCKGFLFYVLSQEPNFSYITSQILPHTKPACGAASAKAGRKTNGKVSV